MKKFDTEQLIFTMVLAFVIFGAYIYRIFLSF